MTTIQNIRISSNQLMINYKGPPLPPKPPKPPKPNCYNNSKGDIIKTLSCIDQEWYKKITFIDQNNKRHLYPEVFFLKDGEATAKYLLNKLGENTISPTKD